MSRTRIKDVDERNAFIMQYINDEIDVQADRRLTPWEREFLESVQEQWEDRQWLSERQGEVLERIWEKL